MRRQYDYAHGRPWSVGASGGCMAESATPTADVEETPEDVVLGEEELLVEDVSIDGMCGVY